MKASKISPWLHKYLGLVLLLFLAWMSVSGVILNHRNLVQHMSVPKWMVPEIYHPDNWNRGTMKGIVWDSIEKKKLFVYGRQGVYVSQNNGQTFTAFMNGDFPDSPWERRTNHLFLEQKTRCLLAATNSGCYLFDYQKARWRQIALPDKNARILKIVKTKERIVFISDSYLFQSKTKDFTEFETIVPVKKTKDKFISLIRVFLELHDGSIWGLPGKLLWDIAGIILFFLCVSAFYIWYYPKKWKRNYKNGKGKSSASEKKTRKFFLKYHKRLGWYFAFLLLIIMLTGMFLRPPLIMAIARGKINKAYYPSLKSDNPWEHKIRNAFYDTKEEKLVLDCKDGVWSGKLSSNKTFTKIKLPVPIFAMGATVFEEEKPGIWLVGSFGGLHRVNYLKGTSEPILQVKQNKNSGRPASVLVTGYLQEHEGKEYILGHYKGVCDTRGNQMEQAFSMPIKIRNDYRMPLWNYLFEIHNARIFKSVLGGFYMLVIPLGALFSLLILLSGIWDYWFSKPKKIKKKRI